MKKKDSDDDLEIDGEAGDYLKHKRTAPKDSLIKKCSNAGIPESGKSLDGNQWESFGPKRSFGEKTIFFKAD